MRAHHPNTVRTGASNSKMLVVVYVSRLFNLYDLCVGDAAPTRSITHGVPSLGLTGYAPVDFTLERIPDWKHLW